MFLCQNVGREYQVEVLLRNSLPWRGPVKPKLRCAVRMCKAGLSLDSCQAESLAPLGAFSLYLSISPQTQEEPI